MADFFREVRTNIIDIIYNSQLNEFVINKFEAMYGESKALQEGYKFDPAELEELVTKRKSFKDFNRAISLMNESLMILKNRDNTLQDPRLIVEVIKPLPKVIKPSRRRRRGSRMLKIPEGLLSFSKNQKRGSMASKDSGIQGSKH